MTSIDLTHVEKRFGKLTVLRDINLNIGKGEFCVFLGPSGCGKSTLLRMIAGIEETTEGELKIDDELMNDVAPADRGVAMVFQNYALYPHMSVFENMAFGLRQAKTPKDEINRRVNEAAHILQIEALLERRPKALSGGQRQRVAIGRAIVRHPDVFLFDEPLSNLDAALRVHMRTEIANLHRNFPAASMVYVTHDQTEAMALADKIVLLRSGPDLMKKGSIAQVGRPLELYHRPKNRFVAGFLGSPSMNFIPVTFESADESGALVRLESGETIRVAVQSDNIAKGDALTLGVRPEHMQPVSDHVSEQVIRRKVRASENFGEYSYLFLSADPENMVIAKVSEDLLALPKAEMAFHLKPTSCHLFDSEGDALPYLAGIPGPDQMSDSESSIRLSDA